MRARNLKPGLFKNEDLGTADPFLTILFEGLWCLADREGRLEDRPMRIKAEVFPYRNFVEKKMEVLLEDLRELGFIRRYEVEGQRIIQCLKFTKHQSPHNTEKDSVLPVEPINYQQDTNITGNIPLKTDAKLDAERPDLLTPDSLIPDSPTPYSPPDAADRAFEFWVKTFGKSKAQFTVERKRKVKARLKDSSLEEIFQAIEGCRGSPVHQGQNDRNTVYDDLELICRSRTHLEKFIGYYNSTKNGSNKTTTHPGTNGNSEPPDVGARNVKRL